MRFTRVSACLLSALVSGGPLMTGAAEAGQSLGVLAAQESARRKAIPQPARVITADDLIPVAGPPPSDSAASSPADTEAVSGGREARVAVAPARLNGGALPQIPIMAVSGGEVVLEVSVSRTGRVTGVKPLRHTAPFTDAMAAAVRSWTFAPAEDALAPPAGGAIDPATRKPMDSTVLVVGVFRPPALFAGTLGEPPVTVAPPSGAAPALAAPIEMPAYPVAALNDGVVLVELDLAASGGVEGIAVVRAAAGFDQLALTAASALAFRPARVHDRAVPAFVYVAFAFRQPIT